MEIHRPLFHLLHYFKVFPCSGCDEPTHCFYYHNGDDKRTTTKKIARRCKFGAECTRGDCKFSHNRFQMSCHYSRFKRKPCRLAETCQNLLCTHWHTPEERDFYNHVNQFLFQKTCEINPYDFFDPTKESVEGFRYFPSTEQLDTLENASFASSQTTFRIRKMSTSRTIFDEESRPDFIYHLEIPIDEDHFHEFKCYNLENLDTFVYPRLAENICSFYNSDGGKLLLGINDDGIVRGVPALDPQRLAFQQKVNNFWREFQPPLHENALELHCYSVVDPNFGKRVPHVYVFELEIEARKDQSIDHLTPEGKFFQRLNASKQRNNNLVSSLVTSSPKSDLLVCGSQGSDNDTDSAKTALSNKAESGTTNEDKLMERGSGNQEVEVKNQIIQKDDDVDEVGRFSVSSGSSSTMTKEDVACSVKEGQLEDICTSSSAANSLPNEIVKNLDEVSSEEISVLIHRKDNKSHTSISVETNERMNAAHDDQISHEENSQINSTNRSGCGTSTASTMETRSIQTELSFLTEKHEKRLQKRLNRVSVSSGMSESSIPGKQTDPVKVPPVTTNKKKVKATCCVMF
eukprot:CAMPEP_0115030812 /NCGR_PEP_ID=MMETSP0216-20121206/38091_1 /TAXON_ID=223996 /ORGANISM="Protocruzia adherens, Strain Boccale" /LENGTH=573 /DNA_ID=CAMNT_0002408203 /DNA_START=457 /DNA_END=2178 /DNA_ORIENTATION=-